MMPQNIFALTPDQLYDQVKDSVVIIKSYNHKGDLMSLGSGIMLPSGKFVTNYHVIKKGAKYRVGQGENFIPAILEAMDQEKDISILSAVGLRAKPANLGQSVKLKVGERVYAVGAPKGLELSLSEGIVSQLRGGTPPIIQTTAAISPGSSGGGLFNAEGELVGITTLQIEEGQNLNFALPVEWIAQVVTQAPTFQPSKESLIRFEIGRQWLVEWKSQYCYQGILEIQRKLAPNQYISKIIIRFLNEKKIQRSVSFDGLLTIQGNDVTIQCSNASESWWVPDNFYLKWHNGVMEGYSADKTGRRGYARFRMVKDSSLLPPPEQRTGESITVTGKLAKQGSDRDDGTAFYTYYIIGKQGQFLLSVNFDSDERKRIVKAEKFGWDITVFGYIDTVVAGPNIGKVVETPEGYKIIKVKHVKTHSIGIKTIVKNIEWSETGDSLVIHTTQGDFLLYMWGGNKEKEKAQRIADILSESEKQKTPIIIYSDQNLIEDVKIP